MQRIWLLKHALLMLYLTGCEPRLPGALIASESPMIINGSSPTALEVVALNARGAEMPARISAVTDAPSILAIDQGRVRCLKAGDARVTASSGRARVIAQIMCRPVATLAPPPPVDLVVGGTPQPIRLSALDSAGAPVTDLRFTATSSDTSVVQVEGGFLMPRSLGSARIRVDLGGAVDELSVEVVEQVVRDTLSMAPGEHRAWRLGPGRYRAEHREMSASEPSLAMQWRSAGANCARDARDAAVLHCVLADSAALALFALRATRARVRIDRRPR